MTPCSNNSHNRSFISSIYTVLYLEKESLPVIVSRAPLPHSMAFLLELETLPCMHAKSLPISGFVLSYIPQRMPSHLLNWCLSRPISRK
jgi:hypothetical protein